MSEQNVSAQRERPRVGTWECLLACETLVWSDEVYDLFELPRGFRVTRTEAIGFYTEESRRTLDEVRTRAISEGGGFTLDADIVTALGKPRRMRIKATVKREKGVPVRLVGTKEDITERAGIGQAA